MTVTVRKIEPRDHAAWLPVWKGYQVFYKTDIPEAVTALTWERLFDGVVPMHGLVAELDGRVVGIVHYIFHYSTWTRGPYVYLQDLFTEDGLRGKGVGSALVNAVYDAARQAGAARVYWLTHETNVTAISLYDKLADRSGFIQYRKLLG